VGEIIMTDASSTKDSNGNSTQFGNPIVEFVVVLILSLLSLALGAWILGVGFLIGGTIIFLLKLKFHIHSWDDPRDKRLRTLFVTLFIILFAIQIISIVVIR
jgi:hypothetical protein